VDANGKVRVAFHDRGVAKPTITSEADEMQRPKVDDRQQTRNEKQTPLRHSTQSDRGEENLERGSPTTALRREKAE